MTGSRYATALLALASFRPCAIVHAQERVPDDAVRQAVQLFAHGDYPAALVRFQQAQQAHPRSANVQNLLGIVLTKLGRLDEAAVHYREAIRLDPALSAARKNLGFNYLTLKKYDLAEQELRAALSIQPADPFLHYYAVMLYLATGKDREALEHLRPARQLLANDAGTSWEAAMACLRQNRSEAALQLVGPVENAFTAKQEYDLAVMLTSRQIYLPAVDRFRRLVSIDPTFWGNRYNLALALLYAKQAAEAATLLEKLAAERPADADILSAFGAALEASDKLPQALEAYQKAVAADAANPDRYLDYTRILMELDRFDESSQFLLEGLKTVKDSYALQMRLGAVHLMTGNYEQARLDFDNAIQQHPEIPLAYIAVARTYLKQGRDAEAVQFLAAARQSLAPDFMLEFYYGLELLRVDKSAEAIDALRRAVLMNPQAPEPHYELGRAYLRVNGMGEARTEFERVIQLAPRHANACYQLSRIYAVKGEAAKAREMAERTRELKQSERQEGLRAQRRRLSAFQPPETIR